MTEGYYYDRGIYYVIIGWILTTILLLAVLTRLYSRAALTRSIGSDDFCITIAACLSLSGMVQDTLSVAHGLGKHESLLSPAQLTQVNKWTYIDWVVVFISYFFVRASVMLFVLRLLPPGKKWATRVILGAFILNFAITLEATIAYGLKCTPFNAVWDTNVKNAKCYSESVVTVTQEVNGALACLIDIITALIPQFLLWKVQMKRSTKLSLDIIFGLGLITAGLSIARVSVVNAGIWAEDSSWRAMNTNTIGMVEEKCGIIFASGPALRQFVAYWRRTGTPFPSKKRQKPDQDFQRFRGRVIWRDIFWYRQASLTNGRVLGPQQMFCAPYSGLSNGSNSTEKNVDATAKKSALTSMAGKAKHFFGRGTYNPTPAEKGSRMETSSKPSMETRLWHSNSSNLQYRESESQDHDNLAARSVPSFDVEAARPQEDTRLAETLARPERVHSLARPDYRPA